MLIITCLNNFHATHGILIISAKPQTKLIRLASILYSKYLNWWYFYTIHVFLGSFYFIFVSAYSVHKTYIFKHLEAKRNSKPPSVLWLYILVLINYTINSALFEANVYFKIAKQRKRMTPWGVELPAGDY